MPSLWFVPPPPPPPPPFLPLGGGGDKPLWGDLILYEGSNIFNTLSLFHLFRNSRHPEK